ncbi:MAG: YeeE/YedE family protein [Alphaproteobacteria bacterium]
MENFTPISAAIGGVLIGLASGVLWLSNGRIAGVSGILGNLIPSRDGQFPWRLAFLVGLPIGAVAGLGIGPSIIADMSAAIPEIPFDPISLILTGLIVGVGTQLGNGCTSGHGVCGVARLSNRSLVATATFVVTGALAVFVVRHIL